MLFELCRGQISNACSTTKSTWAYTFEIIYVSFRPKRE